MEKWQEYSKAIVAFLGSVVVIATALIEGVESVTEALSVLAALGLPVGVYAVPNVKKPTPAE